MVKIGLDIGHGTNTFPPSKGVYKNGKPYEEHDFNSALAVKVKNLLMLNGFGVIMAQQPFSLEVPLHERGEIYEDAGADLVVSLHANWNFNSNTNGTCVFYWHTNSKGKALAQSVIDNLKADGDSAHGNGLHASQVGSWTNLYITRALPMTSILIENGFMSGSKDFDLIFGSKQSEYTDRRAKAITKAICKRYNKSFKDAGSAANTSGSTFYRVQVGAFKNIASVAKYADQVESKTKFNAYVTEVDGWLKVQIGAFSKKENAEARLKAIKQAGYKDAFITTKSGKAVKEIEPYNDPIDKTSSKPVVKGPVAEFQKWLNTNYKANLDIDNSYGPLTNKAAIKAYQVEMNKQYGAHLKVDGIYGRDSRNTTLNVKRGTRGNITRIIQGLLICKGYNVKGFDGIFGARLEAAVKRFQKVNGLYVDGIFGVNTWDNLLN